MRGLFVFGMVFVRHVRLVGTDRNVNVMEIALKIDVTMQACVITVKLIGMGPFAIVLVRNIARMAVIEEVECVKNVNLTGMERLVHVLDIAAKMDVILMGNAWSVPPDIMETLAYKNVPQIVID